MSTLEERLVKLNPDALLLEPRDIYDPAWVDITNEPDDHWTRPVPSPWVAVYDFELAVDSMSEAAGGGDENIEMAHDWIQFNAMGAWVGENTPTWRDPT